jgi:PKD repeat protein
VLALEPWTYFGCAPVVNLAANFVAPSAVNQGDEVQFDGSSSPSTLLIPGGKYVWNFGDGTPWAVGPSVVHTFAKAGTYTVTLTVIDRGGNLSTYSQVVTVLTTNGQVAPPPSGGSGGGPGGGGGGGNGGGTGPTKPLSVHLQLLPASLRAVLNGGLRLRVNSNQSANGLVTVSISRKAAKAAHIAVGANPTVVIGRGTVSQIRNGSITLRLGLSQRMVTKLHWLRHLTVTVKLSLVPKVGRRVSIVIAGRF